MIRGEYKKNAKVSLVKGSNRKENIFKALELIREDLEVIKGKKNVLIKPNLTAVDQVYANTASESVDVLIDYINTHFSPEHITIAESSGTAYYSKLSTNDVYEKFGYFELVKKYKNLSIETYENTHDFITVPIKTIVGTNKINISKEVLRFDFKISITPPKTHNFAIITLGIKNMAGLVKPGDMSMVHGMKAGKEVDAPKTLFDRLPVGMVSKLRRNLPNWFVNFLFMNFPDYLESVKVIHGNIVEMSKVTFPDMVVIDGYYGMQGDGPIDGYPVDHRIAIASVDPLKADGLAARVMGFDPEEVGYLYIMHKDGMGDMTLKGLVGERIENCIIKYRPHGTYIAQKKWRL